MAGARAGAGEEVFVWGRGGKRFACGLPPIRKAGKGREVGVKRKEEGGGAAAK